MAAAQLALQQAQTSDAAQQATLNHNLPITLLGIVNQLAAHGLGYSGDAVYLPGEARYAYQTNTNTLTNDLLFKQQNIALAQQQKAAADAAQAANDSQANAHNAAQAALSLSEAQHQDKSTLAAAALAAYQAALSNPMYTVSGDPTALIQSILGTG